MLYQLATQHDITLALQLVVIKAWHQLLHIYLLLTFFQLLLQQRTAQHIGQHQPGSAVWKGNIQQCADGVRINTVRLAGNNARLRLSHFFRGHTRVHIRIQKLIMELTAIKLIKPALGTHLCPHGGTIRYHFQFQHVGAIQIV